MEQGTTTRAATVLHTTQPSVSRHLSERQRIADIKLFDTHNGRLRPTNEGRFLYKAIKRYFDGLEQIETVVSIMRRSGTRALRLGCTPTLAVGLLPEVIRIFLMKYPDVHLSLQTVATPQVANLLHQDLIDVALTTGVLNQEDHSPVLLKLAPAVCILPVDHAFTSLPHVSFDMLRGERIISLGEKDDLSILIKAQLRHHGISDEFVVATSSSITVCTLVSAGVGIGIVPPYVASSYEGKLIAKALFPAVDVPIYMAMPKQTAPSFLTYEFIKTLTDITARSAP